MFILEGVLSGHTPPLPEEQKVNENDIDDMVQLCRPCACVHVCMYMHVYAKMCIMCVVVCLSLCVHTCSYIHICVHACAHVCISLCVCTVDAVFL